MYGCGVFKACQRKESGNRNGVRKGSQMAVVKAKHAKGTRVGIRMALGKCYN